MDKTAMRCPNCKASIPNTARYCVNCGATITRPVIIETTPLDAQTFQQAKPLARQERLPTWLWPTVVTFVVGLVVVLLNRRFLALGLPIVLLMSMFVGSVIARNWRVLAAVGIWTMAILLVFRIPNIILPTVFVTLGLTAALFLFRRSRE
jgi:hypothetical protein